jgi:hypothetical protein
VSIELGGFCDPDFAPVAEAFERNFGEGGELGAAVAVRLNGRLGVDLWASLADPLAGRPWEENTITNA